VNIGNDRIVTAKIFAARTSGAIFSLSFNCLF
jgi:hypothetical protein